jgi:hypothetical protein
VVFEAGRINERTLSSPRGVAGQDGVFFAFSLLDLLKTGFRTCSVLAARVRRVLFRCQTLAAQGAGGSSERKKLLLPSVFFYGFA